MKHISPKSEGFTMVELLVVITIIAILAGLTIATMGYAQNSGARNRAKGEIAALSVAIESYKVDNGDYPRDTGKTDTLDARQITDATSQAYKDASLVLYKELSGDTTYTRTKTAGARVYFTFKPSMLTPKAPVGSNTTVTAMVDPFRNAYGYSTIGSKANPVAGQGYNPTFDLWSTAGSAQVDAWLTNW